MVLARVDRDTVEGNLAETLLGDLDFVGADRKQIQAEQSAVIGFGCRCFTRVFVGCLDLSIRHNRALRIKDNSRDRSLRDLRLTQPRHSETKRKDDEETNAHP